MSKFADQSDAWEILPQPANLPCQLVLSTIGSGHLQHHLISCVLAKRGWDRCSLPITMVYNPPEHGCVLYMKMARDGADVFRDAM